jgi:hypothetical protein
MNVPQRKPRDKEKIRQQYLANLQLENSNNTLNLNATKMYKATGASSQVASTMTGTEKLAGLEGLKQIAKDHLVSFRFANPLSAQEAIDSLTADDIKFFNEYAQFIGSDFKGRNVPGKVIANYIKRLRSKLSQTEGVDFGIQQSSGGSILLAGQGDIYSQGDIQETTMRMNGAGFPENVINEVFSLMNGLNRRVSAINLQRAQKEGPERYAVALQANSAVRENAPTVEQLFGMIDGDDPIGMVTALQGAGRLDAYAVSVGEEASNGPVSAGAPVGVGQTGVDYPTEDEDALSEADSLAYDAFKGLPIENMKEVLQGMGIDTTNITTPAQAEDAFLQSKGAFPSRPVAFPSPGMSPLSQGSFGSQSPAPVTPASPEGSAEASPGGGAEAEASPASPQANTPEYMAQELDAFVRGYIKQGQTSDPDMLAPHPMYAKGQHSVMDKLYHALERFHHYAADIEPGVPSLDPIRQMLTREGLEDTRNIDTLFQYIQATYNIIAPVYYAKQPPSPAPSTSSGQTSVATSTGTMSAATSSGNEARGTMTGKGIGSRSALRRVDKYEKPKPYRQFGRHLIHRPRLEDGILMIKYPSGAKHPEMPTQKISEALTRVMKEMADGRMPQYHHFEGLGVKDKELLHKVVRHTQFQNMEVPPPDRDVMDKELDRFDILKGEIEAGNDNKELIKEFKVMLMKFMRQGRIPKKQVNEIMEHLLMMGH